MANIFRSKEVYKRMPGVPAENNPLRPVQGMYVVGDWRPPYYILSGLHISDIKTTKATVVNFTTISEEAYDKDQNMSISRFNVGKLTVQRFTKKYEDIYDDSKIAMTKFNVSPLSVTLYSRAYENIYDDSKISMTKFKITSGLSVLKRHRNPYSTLPEPTLRIKSIETKKATITNVEYDS